MTFAMSDAPALSRYQRYSVPSNSWLASDVSVSVAAAWKVFIRLFHVLLLLSRLGRRRLRHGRGGVATAPAALARDRPTINTELSTSTPNPNASSLFTILTFSS